MESRADDASGSAAPTPRSAPAHPPTRVRRDGVPAGSRRISAGPCGSCASRSSRRASRRGRPAALRVALGAHPVGAGRRRPTALPRARRAHRSPGSSSSHRACLLVAWISSAVDRDGDDGLPPWFFGACSPGSALAVASGAWATFIDRPDPARGPRHELAIRIVATALLAITASRSSSGRLAALAPGARFARRARRRARHRPRLRADARSRSGATSPTSARSRIREEQRSEIAAHLHDSVLQTLALIQNRAGATSEVARHRTRAGARAARRGCTPATRPPTATSAPTFATSRRRSRSTTPSDRRRRGRRVARAGAAATSRRPRARRC